MSDIVTTDVACAEGSISDEFLKDLGSVVSYIHSTDPSDSLALSMVADGGILQFRPSLTGVVWQWTDFNGSDGTVGRSADPSRYTVEFLPEGDVQVVADCNSGSGTAAIDGDKLQLAVSTFRVGCGASSQSDQFLGYLDSAESFMITSGTLVLTLADGVGTVTFEPVIPANPEATPTSA